MRMLLLLYHMLFWAWRAAIVRWRRQRERRVWLQNEYIWVVWRYIQRGELADHCYRKRHQGRRYDVTRVEIGMPRAAPAGDSEALFRRGLVGLYGYRVIR